MNKFKAIDRYMLITIMMIMAWTQNAFSQSVSGTTVTLSGTTGKLLLSEGAGSGTYAAFWKHEQAPIQLVMTNCAKGEVQEFNNTADVFHGINAETGLFTTLPNNMTIVDDKLQIDNWKENYDCSYFAIIAPKGYRILRYIIDADVSGNSNTADVDFREFHLAEHATVIEDNKYVFQATANGESTVIDRVLDYSSSRLYFKVTFPSKDAQYSFKFTSFKVVYAVDESFSASVPNMVDGVATNKFGSGIINLGTFAAQTKDNKLWTFTSSNVSALSEVEVYDASKNDLGFAQVNGSPYYFTATNGDYIMEAPKQFRIVGAKVNFINVSTGDVFDGYEAGNKATPVSGNQYLIKDNDGNYISYINGALTRTVDARTAWTVTTSGNGYTISIGGDSGSGSSVETENINVTTVTGTLYKDGSTTGQTWNNTWKSTSTTPQVTLTASANNITGKTSGNLALASGTAGSSTYTITIDEGYVITGFSAIVSGTAAPTITAGGTTYNVTTTEQTVSVTGLNSSTATFTMGGDNNEVLFSDFVISYQSTASGSGSSSQTTTVTCEETTSREATLFDNPETTSSSTNHYRIPAITLTKDNNLLAISDLRIGGSGDVGSNAISLVARKSADNGTTWGDESTIIAGNGTGFDKAHGDAAVVTDSETGKIILLAASGETGYSTTGVQLGQYYSTDNGANWTGSDITDAIKDAFTAAGLSVQKQFFTSGRIIQSKKVKVGRSYRIYSALCTGNGSIVMYSDDFGSNWAVLGSKVAYSGGDETVLEEFPNGDLLLSARLSGSGRGFTVYNYSDLTTGAGSWAGTTTGISSAANCNGEMLLVPTSNSNVYVLLHSVALSGRNNVTIYYKLIDTTATIYNTPSFYTGDWSIFKQVSTTSSAYSTMVLDTNGDVAFLYEENNTSVNGSESYDIIFKSFKVNVTFPETEPSTDPNIPSTMTYLVHDGTGIGTSTSAEVWENVSGDTWHVQTGTTAEISYSDPGTSVTAGNEYYIKIGDSYLTLNGTTLSATTTPTTKWTFSGTSTTTIKAVDTNYYLSRSGTSLIVSTTSSSWTYNGGRLYQSTTSGNGNKQTYTYYYPQINNSVLSLGSGTFTEKKEDSSHVPANVYVVSETSTEVPAYSSDQTLKFFDIASTKYAEASTDPYTAGLYDKRGENLQSTVSVEHNSLKTLSSNDFNNDGIKFNISGLATNQKAYFNVKLELLPLDPQLQSIQVAVRAKDNQVYNRTVNSLNYEFSDNGNPLVISINSDDYVKDGCILFFQGAHNENENTLSTGNGTSNFFLMGSPFDMYTRSSTDQTKYKAPLPSAVEGNPMYSNPTNWNTTYIMGKNEVEFTNINEFNNTSGPEELTETDFSTLVTEAQINYTASDGVSYVSFKEADDNKITAYVYSCDIPVYNLTEDTHIAYRFYKVMAELNVVDEDPVITLTSISRSTLKGANNKNKSIVADNDVDNDHKFVGIKVTSKLKDGQTGDITGNLNSNEIIEAINTEMAKESNRYAEGDILRGVLYIDMSELTSVTTRDGENPWDAVHAATADNCLYFMPSGFNRNVENTIKGGEGGEALGNIVIKDKQPFFSPYKFKTGTFNALYTREITGGTSTGTVANSTIILPFDVTLDADGKATDVKNNGEDETVTFFTLGELGSKTDNDGNVYTIGVKPVTTGKALADIPYHIQSTNSMSDKSFAISESNATIIKTSASAEYSSAHADGWTGYGSYFGVGIPMTGAISGAETFYFSRDRYYRSSALASSFDKFYVLPFRAYFATTGTIPSDAKALIISDGDDATSIGISEQNVDDASDKIYNIQGIRINKNDMKRHGIYIVNGKKIVKF